MSKLSVETEYDKAVTALARSLANCSVSHCHGRRCFECETKKQQDNVYNNLADIDKLRVQNELSDMLRVIHQPKPRMVRATLLGIWDARGAIIATLIVLFILFGVPFLLPAETSGYNNIQRALRDTVHNIRDVNEDDKINCVDYAIVFKHVWDIANDPRDCELVRNLSPDFNHLFVRIRWNGEWVYVEPSAYFYGYIYRYTMTEFWEDRYDSQYNFYNETEYWMKYDKQINR